MPASPRKLDMRKVKERSPFRKKHKPEGEYVAKILDVEDYEASSGNDNWLFTIQLQEDRRAVYPYYCGLDTEQLWKVRNLAVASGMKVPKKLVKMDPNKLVGRLIGVVLEDDEYEGRLQSTIADVLPVEEVEPAEADDEDEMEDEDEEIEEEIEEEDEDEEDEEDEEEDEEEEPPPVKKKTKKAPAKKSKSKKKQPVDEDEDEELEELEIEEL